MKPRAAVLAALLLLIASDLLGCQGKSPLVAGDSAQANGAAPGLADIEASPAGPAPFQLPFPADDGASKPNSRRASGTEITPYNGVQTWQRGGTTNEAGTQLVLDPAAADFAWAIYQFSGMADGDKVTNITIGVSSPGPGNYWIGWADYHSRSWIWQQRGDKVASTSVDDVFEPPSGVRPISYNGNVQVAVVAWDAMPVDIYTVTLTAELYDVPVAVVFASPAIGNQDLTVTFDASLSHVRGGGAITEFEWDWDGAANGWSFESTGTDDSPQHTYTEPGRYQPVLRVTGPPNNTDLGTAAVTVSGWVQTWGGDQYERNTAVAIDEAGSTYLAGESHSFGSYFANVMVLKYDSHHNLAWIRTFSGDENANDYAYAIAASGGSVYVAGFTEGFGASLKDLLLLKYSSGGELQWAETWTGGAFDGAYGVALSEDGYIYVGGSSTSFGNDAEALVLKYEPNGNLVWARTWGGVNADHIHAIAIYDNDTIYTAGETQSFGNGGSDLLLLKWNSSGVAVWGRTWGKNLWEGANAMSLDLSGRIYLAGGTASVAPGTPPNVLVLKFTSAGALEWARSWGTAEPEVATAAATGGLIPGDFYVGGKISVSGTDYPLLLKFGTDGTFEWRRTWLAGTTDDDGLYGMAVGPGGVLLLAGASEKAMGIWDDADQQSPVVYLDPVESAVATSHAVEGTKTVLTDYLDESPTGVEDTGGGEQDALLLEFYPDDL